MTEARRNYWSFDYKGHLVDISQLPPTQDRGGRFRILIRLERSDGGDPVKVYDLVTNSAQPIQDVAKLAEKILDTEAEERVARDKLEIAIDRVATARANLMNLLAYTEQYVPEGGEGADDGTG